MFITRRNAIKLLAGALPALKSLQPVLAEDSIPAIQTGPFKGTRQSLKAYRIPEWFRDAKFGIWAHWGPQSAPEYGDWYARRMYIEGEWQYDYHLKRYGHPSKFGFKDVIATWKAEKFDADYLMSLYKKAGAKYFMTLAVHHDNFDLWNSRHTRWNSVKIGPKKDIVGMFRQAARRHGLKFAVSEHLAMSYKWFSVSHGSDKKGEYADVPYDGADTKNSDLYHDIKEIYVDLPWNLNGTSEQFKRQWFIRIKDLVDAYQPDMLYTDGPIPFDQWGLNLVAHFYNQGAKRNRGKVDVVYTSKRMEDCETGTCAFDVERGVIEKIWPEPWQSHTCIGDWHYSKRATYKSPKIIIDMLVDIVSRNGNLMLNFPLQSNGTLDSTEEKILSEITDWMRINGEAIYATRPWKIYGSGPSTQVAANDPKFNESKRKELTAEDIRFTTKGDTLFVFLMGWPQTQADVAPLTTGKVENVEMLGYKGKLQWSQDAAGLKIQMPAERPCNHAVALKVTGLKLT